MSWSGTKLLAPRLWSPRPARRTWRSLLLQCVLVASLLPSPGAEELPCQLRSLHLRYRDRPVDLKPPFTPDAFSYEATMDFAMNAFSIDAIPAFGCITDKVPFRAIPVPNGETYQVTIFAKKENDQMQQPYVIKVTRLTGTETELQNITIAGATVVPDFSEDLRSYRSQLSIGEDFISVHYTKKDTGQTVKITADPQVTVNQSSTTASASGARRLDGLVLATGEAQYVDEHQFFPIDHAHSRQLSLTVASADSTNQKEATYSVVVTRAGCPVVKPVYDPLSRGCVINCGEGYYRKRDVERCSRCNANCKVCSSVLRCELCQQDTMTENYVLQPDGSCKVVESSVLAKYYWWCVSAALFAGLLGLLGLGFLGHCLCQCVCSLCGGDDRYGIDSDSDASPQSARLVRGRG